MAFTEADAEERARVYARAWSSRDPRAVAALYAPDARFTINDGEPYVGRSAIADMVAGFVESFPDLVLRVDSFRTSGTYLVFLWTVEGTYTGAEGAGRRVRFSGWEQSRLTEDGLVAESLGYYDADAYERQLNGA